MIHNDCRWVIYENDEWSGFALEDPRFVDSPRAMLSHHKEIVTRIGPCPSYEDACKTARELMADHGGILRTVGWDGPRGEWT